ncbi:MAG: sigma-70 family RNA polymerase sigma factor [Propionicimonas sp.]|uniref:sigma-70 family RNA polymerase sigma factor n=1 Tax=Propionicimonas sp. TaxID=1955623 RepID=UPI003D0985A2
MSLAADAFRADDVDDVAGLDDSELLQRSRGGDATAFAELFVRYRALAVRIATRTSRDVDADDVAAEAFARVWSAVSRGRGPERVFRPYLAAAVRNVALNMCRGARDVPTDPVMLPEVEVIDATSTGIAEAERIQQAFDGLPPRWRAALQAVDIDDVPVQDFARRNGLSANAASALCLRAREGLKVAWLQGHVQRAGRSEECTWTLERLGTFQRGRLPAAQRDRVDAHLAECADCRSTRGRLAVVAGALKVSTLFAGTAGAALAAKAALGAAGATATVTASGAPLSVNIVGAWTKALPAWKATATGLLQTGAVQVAGGAVAAVALVAGAVGIASASEQQPAGSAQAAVVAATTPARPASAPATTTPPTPEPTRSPTTTPTPTARTTPTPRVESTTTQRVRKKATPRVTTPADPTPTPSAPTPSRTPVAPTEPPRNIPIPSPPGDPEPAGSPKPSPSPADDPEPAPVPTGTPSTGTPAGPPSTGRPPWPGVGPGRPSPTSTPAGR